MEYDLHVLLRRGSESMERKRTKEAARIMLRFMLEREREGEERESVKESV